MGGCGSGRRSSRRRSRGWSIRPRPRTRSRIRSTASTRTATRWPMSWRGGRPGWRRSRQPAEQGLPDDAATEIADKEQRSFADDDARIMLMKRGAYDYAYNAQAVVD